LSPILSKQKKFAYLIGCLLVFIGRQPNLFVTVGDFFASTGHMNDSLHGERLAADLNLFVDGQYVTGENEAWSTLANFWKALDEGCRWGGDFEIRDYNHFSIEDNGRQ
jgi:D-alanyl-D-alanine carboxypeptidase